MLCQHVHELHLEDRLYREQGTLAHRQALRARRADLAPTEPHIRGAARQARGAAQLGEGEEGGLRSFLL